VRAVLPKVAEAGSVPADGVDLEIVAGHGVEPRRHDDHVQLDLLSADDQALLGVALDGFALTSWSVTLGRL
jgi:hypothetical protein